MKAPYKGGGAQGRYEDDSEPPKFSWLPVFEIVCILAIVGFFSMIFNR